MQYIHKDEPSIGKYNIENGKMNKTGLSILVKGVKGDEGLQR